MAYVPRLSYPHCPISCHHNFGEHTIWDDAGAGDTAWGELQVFPYTNVYYEEQCANGSEMMVPLQEEYKDSNTFSSLPSPTYGFQEWQGSARMSVDSIHGPGEAYLDPSDIFFGGEAKCRPFPFELPHQLEQNVLVQQVPMTVHDEECGIKVGRYSIEERKSRILRYLKKRNQRNFSKTIKYACRKTLADRRVRVRGRFAKNTGSPCEEETEAGHSLSKSQSIPCQQDKVPIFSDRILQMKQDGEDDWVQEALASLLYLPYESI